MEGKRFSKRLVYIVVVLLSMFFILPVGYAQVTNTTFTDIAGHWAKSSIEKLASLGIIGGYPDGTFKPDRVVTRGEMASVIASSEENVDKKLAEKVAFPIKSSIEPKRGCAACHVGNYNLQHEAALRAEARGSKHPVLAPDGTSLALDAPNAKVSSCLTCHAPGTGDRKGKGAAAPLALRDIVHPAHMSSQVFKVYYGGNCFTCHNVDGEGTFELLSEAVDTNEKGVPNPSKMPIPGTIPPTETK